jgi:hypothetical protein
MYPKILVTYPGALAEWLRRLTRINFLISNPFVGKSSNLLGVDILFFPVCWHGSFWKEWSWEIFGDFRLRVMWAWRLGGRSGEECGRKVGRKVQPNNLSRVIPISIPSASNSNNTRPILFQRLLDSIWVFFLWSGSRTIGWKSQRSCCGWVITKKRFHRAGFWKASICQWDIRINISVQDCRYTKQQCWPKNTKQDSSINQIGDGEGAYKSWVTAARQSMHQKIHRTSQSMAQDVEAETHLRTWFSWWRLYRIVTCRERWLFWKFLN